jgi:DNA-binding Lrp family transcriptional regulator
LLTDEERQLLLAIQDGLPLVPQPYREVGERLGMSEDRVMELVRSMLSEGKIKRLGAVPNHYVLGIRANGMAVWDVPDDRVSEVGARLGQMPEVTHCYRRPRRPPDWRYNLFAMVHGYTREQVLTSVERIARELGIDDLPHEVVFSTRLLKKQGTRVQTRAERRGSHNG